MLSNYFGWPKKINQYWIVMNNLSKIIYVLISLVCFVALHLTEKIGTQMTLPELRTCQFDAYL